MRDGGLGFFARALSFTVFSSLRTVIHSPTTPRLDILLFLFVFFFGSSWTWFSFYNVYLGILGYIVVVQQSNHR
jgi:hypothetical protein